MRVCLFEGSVEERHVLVRKTNASCAPLSFDGGDPLKVMDGCAIFVPLPPPPLIVCAAEIIFFFFASRFLNDLASIENQPFLHLTLSARALLFYGEKNYKKIVHTPSPFSIFMAEGGGGNLGNKLAPQQKKRDAGE